MSNRARRSLLNGDGQFDLPLVGIVVPDLNVINRERPPVLGRGIDDHSGLIALAVGVVVLIAPDQLLGVLLVTVIDVGIGDHVDHESRLQAGAMRHHDDQHGVLADVPVIGDHDVVGALVDDGVQVEILRLVVVSDVEGHTVHTRTQVHRVQVFMTVHVGQDGPAHGTVRQVMENSLHLVAPGVAVAGLLADLVTVGLTDAAALIRPGVPDVGIQVVDVIGALLVDPEDLIQSGLPVDGAELQNGQLAVPEVIVLGDAEDFAGMGGFAVLPLGPDVQPLVTER